MRPQTWTPLQRALTEDEVLEAVREFAAAWHPEDLKLLPQGCRPGKIRDAEDICAMAVGLARAQFRGDPEDHAAMLALENMRAYFAEAAERIAVVGAWSRWRTRVESHADA